MFESFAARDAPRPPLAAPLSRVLFGDEFDDYPDGITVLDEPTDGAGTPDASEPIVEPAPDLNLIRAEATAQARGAALREIAAERDRASVHLMEKLSTALTTNANAAVALAEDAADALARLLLGMLAAALPSLCARHGATELGAIAARLLPAMTAAPQVDIRVHPDASGPLDAVVAKLDAALARRVVVTRTDAVAPGDVQITWQDGQAGRDTAAVLREIDDILGPLGLLAHDTVEA